MTEDKFLDQLRSDAQRLRYDPDAFAMTRISARIRERITRPGVAEILARWVRPIAATASILVIAASIGIGLFDRSDDTFTLDEPLEISIAGDSYSVSQ